MNSRAKTDTSPVKALSLGSEVKLRTIDSATGILELDSSHPTSSSTCTIAIPKLKRFTAWTLTSHFVTSPFFGSDLGAVPGRGQFFLWEEEDGTFGVLLPLLDGDYRSEFRGVPDGLEFSASCGPTGRHQTEIDTALVRIANDPYEALQKGIFAAVEVMGRGRVREQKTTPKWMDLVGWCTWDAFYEKVDQTNIEEGLASFQAAGFVPGHVIIDEGWQDYDTKHYLLSLGLKTGAFAGDTLKSVVRAAKEGYGVKMIGCWRTLFGELRGVSVDSPALSLFRRRLVHEPGTEADTFGVIELEDVERFHKTYAAALAADGVDFVKVDFQSALHLMTYDQCGRAEGAKIWQHALQASVNEFFDGEMLNCMALGTDEVYHTLSSNVARASDDFFPTKDTSHPAHIGQNAFNALWLSQIQWPDWDMFHSRHPWALYHAIGRAISGGPVYVSDKPGESDCALLKRFVDSSGVVLRCPQPGLPTREMIFGDPIGTRRMIRVFNRTNRVGLLAVFHPDSSGEPVEEEVSPQEIEGLERTRTAIFSVIRGFLGALDSSASWEVKLGIREADLFVMSPIQFGFAVFGLIDKWNPSAAIIDLAEGADGWKITSRCGGRFGFYVEHPLREIRCNGRSSAWVESDGFVTFDTPEEKCCVIEVLRK